MNNVMAETNAKQDLRSSKYNEVVSQNPNHIVLYINFHTTRTEAKESERKIRSHPAKTPYKKIIDALHYSKSCMLTRILLLVSKLQSYFYSIIKKTLLLQTN